MRYPGQVAAQRPGDVALCELPGLAFDRGRVADVASGEAPQAPAAHLLEMGDLMHPVPGLRGILSVAKDDDALQRDRPGLRVEEGVSLHGGGAAAADAVADAVEHVVVEEAGERLANVGRHRRNAFRQRLAPGGAEPHGQCRRQRPIPPLGNERARTSAGRHHSRHEHYGLSEAARRASQRHHQPPAASFCPAKASLRVISYSAFLGS